MLKNLDKLLERKQACRWPWQKIRCHRSSRRRQMLSDFNLLRKISFDWTSCRGSHHRFPTAARPCSSLPWCCSCHSHVAQGESRAGVPLLEVVNFGAFAEVQRGAAGLTAAFATRGAATEPARRARGDDELKRQLGVLQVQFQQSARGRSVARQLERLLGFQQDCASRPSLQRNRRSASL